MGSKVEMFAKELSRKNKKNILHKGLKSYELTRIPFTSPKMNYMTYGGIPLGRVVEFYGLDSGGKTTTALDITGNAQRLFNKVYKDEIKEIKSKIKGKGVSKKELSTLNELLQEKESSSPREVLYVDCENTLDPEWATKLGVDVDSLIMLTPDSESAEEIFEMIKKLIMTGEIGLVVIDSIGAMVSQQELGKDITESTYGGISQALTKFCKKIAGLCTKENCTIIGINQVRDSMDNPFDPLKTTGGKSWRHTCSMRMEFKKGKFVNSLGEELTRKDSVKPRGNVVMVDLFKSKVCKQDRKIGSYLIDYNKGVNAELDLIELALAVNIIVGSGAWYYIVNMETGEYLKNEKDEDLKFKGKKSLISFLKEDKEVFRYVEECINNYEEDI